LSGLGTGPSFSHDGVSQSKEPVGQDPLQIPTIVKPVQGKYFSVPHISSRSGGDPLVITPWLTNHNRDLETSLGLVTPRAGPQLKA